MFKRILLAVMLGCWLVPPAVCVHGAPSVETSASEREKPPLLPDPTKRQTWLQALWTVIIFLVMVIILYKTAWKNVLEGLKRREQRIRQDIADAEEARRRAEETLRKYTQQLAEAEERVREMLSKAAADGEKLATTIRMQAQNEAEQIKERAEKDIDAAKHHAIGEIYETAAEIATAVAEKIIGRNLNVEDQRELVRRSLDQLHTLNKN